MTDTRTNIKSQPRNPKGQVIGNSPTKPILDALNEGIIAIRKRHAEVPNIVLVVGTSSRTKYGHFDPDKWDSKAATHEIMLSGESLARGAVATFGTLLHECAHAYAATQGIKDTSRQGRFHNKKFKELGEKLGLHLENDPRIGWSVTSVPKETQIEYKAEIAALAKALKAYRKPEAPKPTKKTTVRVECDCRKVSVPIGFWEKGSFSCDLCGEPFEEMGA